MIKQNFIKTTDKETANKLIACGLQLVSHVGGVYTFLNNPSENFSSSSIDNTKCYFTNILSM